MLLLGVTIKSSMGSSSEGAKTASPSSFLGDGSVEE